MAEKKHKVVAVTQDGWGCKEADLREKKLSHSSRHRGTEGTPQGTAPLQVSNGAGDLTLISRLFNLDNSILETSKQLLT